MNVKRVVMGARGAGKTYAQMERARTLDKNKRHKYLVYQIIENEGEEQEYWAFEGTWAECCAYLYGAQQYTTKDIRLRIRRVN